MSINDLLDSEVFLPAMFAIFAVAIVVGIPVAIAKFKQTTSDIYGEDEYEYGTIYEEKNTKIIARRTTQHPSNKALIINTVVFELANGNRVELAIKDASTYGVMIEGDCGTLKYQGKKFISFKRGNDNEA